MSQTKQSMVDEKQFELELEEVELHQSRVHAPQLALCVVFPSHKTQYDDTSKLESQQLTDLMTRVYDVYQPDIATINCGYKTNNKDPHIHWLFDFSVNKFNSNLKDIAENTHHSDTKIKLERHIEHFNKQRVKFSNCFKLMNFIYIQNDIVLYKEMFPNIIPKNIPENIDFDQIRCEFNNNYNRRSASVFIIIPIQSDQCLTEKSQQIDDALQNLIRFTHNSRDSMVRFIKGANKPMTNLHNQALQWFELSVTRNVHKQQILVRSTVTIFHFLCILLRNSDIHNPEIPSWFEKYCDYVADNKKMLSEYNSISCAYQHHNELHFRVYAKELKKMICIGQGSKNRRLDCDKIVNDGINQIQSNISEHLEDVKKCTECGITIKGEVYAADGLFYCLQCWVVPLDDYMSDETNYEDEDWGITMPDYKKMHSKKATVKTLLRRERSDHNMNIRA